METPPLRKPEWLRIKLPEASEYGYVKEHLSRYNLHTICESGNCPNQGECWAAKTATFMILGNTCTRNCRFCGVNHGHPETPDPLEPKHLAKVIEELKIKHCVLTSVTRDDLADGGAAHWAATIRAVKANGFSTVEALIPDFEGNENQLQEVIDAGPDIIAHNIETVKRMTALIRIKAQYGRSLGVIKYLSDHNQQSKSGIMVGLGETDEEIYETIEDLARVNCKILTIGQYLQPSRKNHEVKRYVTPSQFAEYKSFAISAGIPYVESGPLVRSSYHAEKFVRKNLEKR